MIIEKLLLERWQKNQLGHFYIVRPPLLTSNKKVFLREWIEDFLAQLLVSKFPRSYADYRQQLKSGHPDILFLRKTEEASEAATSNYTLDEFTEFFDFLLLRPFQLGYRFVVVEDIHLIDDTLGNKLLKSLEEPPSHTTIFFLETVSKSYLATLEGRAQSLRLRLPSKEKASSPITPEQRLRTLQELCANENSPHFIASEILHKIALYQEKGEGLPNLLEDLKKNPLALNNLQLAILALERKTASTYTRKERLIQDLRWAQKSKTYHNSASERALTLLSGLIY